MNEPKYLLVPEVSEMEPCRGCVWLHRNDCHELREKYNTGECFVQDGDGNVVVSKVVIRNTPKGRTAYAIARLEADK